MNNTYRGFNSLGEGYDPMLFFLFSKNERKHFPKLTLVLTTIYLLFVIGMILLFILSPDPKNQSYSVPP